MNWGQFKDPFLFAWHPGNILVSYTIGGTFEYSFRPKKYSANTVDSLQFNNRLGPFLNFNPFTKMELNIFFEKVLSFDFLGQGLGHAKPSILFHLNATHGTS